MFVTALLAASLAAPVPKAKPAELYLPTVEATKRVWQTKGDDGRVTDRFKLRVSKVVEKVGVYTVTVADAWGGDPPMEYRYEVSAKGLLTLADPNGDLAEPEPLLKLPASEGDTWTHERATPKQSVISTTFTVGKEEEVTVPAGKFKAIPVTAEVTQKGSTRRVTTWYAVGVGEVKWVVGTGDTEAVWELTEFTPGKAKEEKR
jgi:hypothetical protein